MIGGPVYWWYGASSSSTAYSPGTVVLCSQSQVSRGMSTASQVTSLGDACNSFYRSGNNMIHASVRSGNPAALLSRLSSLSGSLISPQSVSEIRFSIFKGESESAEVTGTLPVSSTLFTSPQTNYHWEDEDNGYNFRHILSPGTLDDSDSVYRIEHTLVISGQDHHLSPFKIYTLPHTS